MNKNVLTGIIVIVAVGLVVWYVGFYAQPSATPQKQTSSVQLETKSNSLGEQIYKQTTNPVGEQLPQTNPVEQVSTPFSGYTNPFDTK
ncbi:MAG TPA: hypothetical protein VGQ87_04080 [Patescibacteria group bacterium]|jgi:hypothetical protein|nr:hypothetical protein [Patescibacteria group bacterium]